MHTVYFDTCVGIHPSDSFRDRTFYFLQYGRVMIASPNTAPWPNDTFRNIGHLASHGALCGSYRLYLVVESIRVMSLLKYLADNALGHLLVPSSPK